MVLIQSSPSIARAILTLHSFAPKPPPFHDFWQMMLPLARQPVLLALARSTLSVQLMPMGCNAEMRQVMVVAVMVVVVLVAALLLPPARHSQQREPWRWPPPANFA
jgi:hypothetical protein